MTATVNRRTPLHQGRVFLMVRENVTLDKGVSTDLDFIDDPGAAAIVPLIAPGEILLIRQYRHALKQYIWEVPAGTLDPGEPVMDCARRELIEENGVRGAGVARTRGNHARAQLLGRERPSFSDG